MSRLSLRWLWACLLAASAGGFTAPWARVLRLRELQASDAVTAPAKESGGTSSWVKRLLEEEEEEEHDDDEDTAVARDGIIHFLFLLNDSLPNEQLWRRFLDEAPPGSYHVWAHYSDPGGADRVPSWQELTVVPTVPSFYCGDLVSPMAQLARVAHRGASARDKFVFLSDTTLPVKPFRDVHDALLRDQKSDFCVDATHQWPVAQVEGDTYRMVKHEQWVVLNYRHAKRFAQHWDWSHDATKQKIRLGSSGVRLSAGKALERKRFKPYRCSDEVMVFATIFGAYTDVMHENPVSLSVDVQAPAARLVYAGLGSLDASKEQDYQGRCRTLVKFGPRDGRDSARDLVLRDVSKDRRSKVVSLGGSHPVEFSEVGEAGLVALRRSPFLFARKWPRDAERSSPHFSTVMSAAYRMPG